MLESDQSVAPASAQNNDTPLPWPVSIPFVESLGVTLHVYGQGHSELRVDLTDRHMNGWQVAHGGVVMTMLDVAMAVAARSVQGNGQGVATVEMKSSFMRPAQHRLRVIGLVLHQTATLAFCEAKLLDDAGHLCASGTGTFKYLRGLARRSAPSN